MEQQFLKTVALIESILQSGTEDVYSEVFEQYEGSIYQTLMIVDWRKRIYHYCLLSESNFDYSLSR